MERRFARQHGKHDQSEVVEVAAAIDVLACCLLRGHVLRSAKNATRPRQTRFAEEFCDAEVGELDMKSAPCGRWENQIGGLEIAMHHPQVMRRFESPDDLLRDAYGVPPREPLSRPKQCLERQPRHIIHDEKRQSFLLAPLAHVNDARVRELLERLDL